MLNVAHGRLKKGVCLGGLQFAAFTLSVVWGLGLYITSRMAWSHHENGHMVNAIVLNHVHHVCIS